MYNIRQPLDADYSELIELSYSVRNCTYEHWISRDTVGSELVAQQIGLVEKFIDNVNETFHIKVTVIQEDIAELFGTYRHWLRQISETDFVSIIETGYYVIVGAGEAVTSSQIGARDTIISKELIYGQVPYIERAFNFSEFVSNKRLIGTIPAGKRVEKVVLIITSTFDIGTQLAIGEEAAHGRLMTTSDNNPQNSDIYEATAYYKFSTETNLYIYLEAGSLTTGEGVAIVYYT